jgi:hypothetical protein
MGSPAVKLLLCRVPCLAVVQLMLLLSCFRLRASGQHLGCELGPALAWGGGGASHVYGLTRQLSRVQNGLSLCYLSASRQCR